MEKSDTIKNLADALCKFQSSMEAIAKDAINPFFHSKYASLSAIIEDTRKPLAVVGLSYAQFPSGDGELTTVLMHNSGEWMAATFATKPVDAKPQSVGSAITYARRYALCAVLGLQVEDDDANQASATPAKAAAKPAAKPVSKPWQAPSVLDRAKAIKQLVDGVVLTPLTKEGYAPYVLEQTGLALVPDNYDAIIKKLNDNKNDPIQHQRAA